MGVTAFANHKAVIVGAGAVGSQCAASLMMLDLVDEIALIDVDPGCARAQAMDLDDMASGLKQRVAVRVGSYDDCADAQFVIMTAGRSRRPGQSRRDMLAATMNIMQPISQSIKASGFDGILISVTNPADVVAEYLYRQLGRHLKFADGWNKYIISSEPEFEHYFGKQATKKRKLYNGRLQCNVYMYY
jgi:L-lactate dehydrogenase